jgi:hypothetical protein
VLAREADHLTRFGFREVARIDTGHPDPFGVNVKHDLIGRGNVVLEKLHENVYDENLRGVVVVVEHDLIETWSLHLDLFKGRKFALFLRFATRHGFQTS